MDKEQRFRLKTLEHLLKTKSMPAQVRKDEKVISSLGFFLMLGFVVAPALYFRDVGDAKYILMICGALAGFSAAYWQLNLFGNRQLRILHDFIDFDGVKAELRGRDA